MSRLVSVCGMVVSICVGAIVVASVLHHSPQSQQSPRLEGTSVWPAGMRPAPAFALRDQTGHLISRDGLHGRVWAITFLDSHCTEACPVEARALATVQKRLGWTHPLQVIIVSVLPWYDTPARVRAFARKTGLTANWHWLLGTQRQLSPVWKRYGIWVLSGLQHTAAVYLVDRFGDVRVADSVPFLPSQLAASVLALNGQSGSHA